MQGEKHLDIHRYSASHTITYVYLNVVPLTLFSPRLPPFPDFRQAIPSFSLPSFLSPHPSSLPPSPLPTPKRYHSAVAPRPILPLPPPPPPSLLHAHGRPR